LKYKEKLSRECKPLEFASFKANPIPWTSQVNLYEDIITKHKREREMRVEERARQNLQSAKLPPRMEMHERKKKQQEEEVKSMQSNISNTINRSKSVSKVKQVPNFEKKYETFMNMMEKKKSKVIPTNPIPFNFMESKKKANLREYMDIENDPQAKNPNLKKNIEEILMKIQQKPKIEPASTKSLDLLIEFRRKNMEDKLKIEEKKMEEDKERVKNQNKLKERVVNSKFLVDNKKKLEEDKKKRQDAFKESLRKQAIEYKMELEKTKQKVYNKPLNFEENYSSYNKLKNNKITGEFVRDIIEEEEVK
jgi:hypothetical protein